MATINALQLPDPDKMTPVDLSPLGQIDEACCACLLCCNVLQIGELDKPAGEC